MGCLNKNVRLSLNKNAIPSLMKCQNKFVHREVNRYVKQSMTKFAPLIMRRTVKQCKIENAQLILKASALLEQKENVTQCIIQSMKRSARLRTNSYVAMYRNRCVTMLINNNVTLSMNKSAILFMTLLMRRSVTLSMSKFATLPMKKFVIQLNLLMEEMEEEEDPAEDQEEEVQLLNMVLLQLLPVEGFQNKNVKVCQDNSARMYQERLKDKSVIMCQDRSAKMSLRKFAIVYKSKN